MIKNLKIKMQKGLRNKTLKEFVFFMNLIKVSEKVS